MERTFFVKGPDPKLKLAYSDVWLSGLFSRRVLVFEISAGSSHEKAIAIIHQALQSLVDGTPELGSLSVIVPEAEHDGKTPWRALAPYRGIEFIVKDFTHTFSSFAELQSRGFPIGVFKDRLLMPIPYRVEPAPQPQARVQASLIQGGLLLSICIFHHLTDGNGMNTIVRALSQACNRAAAAAPDCSIPPVILNTDRTLMHSLHGTQTDLVHHPAHRLIPDIYRPRIGAPSSSASPPDTMPLDSMAVAFRLPSIRAARLKTDATTTSSSTLISTHDAIVALLWRTLMLARHSAGHLATTDIAILSFPVDARRFVGLPADWIGNCVYFCEVERSVSDFWPGQEDSEAEAEVLREVAAQIHAARATVDAARVAGIMTRRRTEPYNIAWWPAGRVRDPKVLVSTSFYHSGMLKEDWGGALGRVKHFTTTDVGSMAGGFERTAFVGPMFEDGKGCNVVAGVDAKEREFFGKDRLWNSYFEPSTE